MQSDLGMPAQSNTYCGQSPRRLIAGDAHLQGKSSLIGDASGGDPPMLKSERKLGNSEKNQGLYDRERELEKV